MAVVRRGCSSQREPKRGIFRSDARPLLGLFGLSGAFFWHDDQTTSLLDQRSLASGPVQDHLIGLKSGRFQEGVAWLLDQQLTANGDFLVVDRSESDFVFALAQSLDVENFVAVNFNSDASAPEAGAISNKQPDHRAVLDQSGGGEVIECGPLGEGADSQPELECAPPDPLADEIFESFTGMPVALDLSGDVLSAAVSSTVFGGSGIYASSSSSTSISSSAVVSTAVSTAVSGAVIDGYVEGATVFADLNGDGVFNTGEPSAITDSSGGYTLTTTASLDGISIVSTGGTDVTTGATVDYMVAPAGVTYVTPISTLTHYSNEAGGDPLTLLADLGFTTEDLLVDPVVAGNEDFLAAGAGILTAVASASSLISGASGVDQSTVAQRVFNQLAQKDTATIKTLADRTDGAALSETELAEISTVMATLITDAVAANSSFGSMDADVINTAAESIGQTIGALRQAANLSDVQVLASVGQAVMSTELKAIGEALKNGDADLETLKSGLSSKYGDADQIAKVQQGRQAALNSKNNAVDGVTIESDELTVSMASDGSLNPTSFLSTTDADNVLFDNDVFASSVDPTIMRVTNLGSSDISVDLTRMQLDGGLQFVFGDSFATFDAEALDASSFSSATDIITLLTTASESFGDYYFEYAVDVGGQKATGLMTLHVVPEIQLDAVTSISVNEDAPILLSDLIITRTYGPGDRLVLEGLPEGTQVIAQANADGDEGYTGASLSLTASTGALVIGPEWLLPWRFDDIEIVLPDNYKVDFTFDLTLKAQYESASVSSTDTILVDLTAVSDGVDAANLDLATLTQTAVEPSRELVEGFSSNLFETTTGLIEVLQAAQIDVTEGLAVRIGVPSTGVTLSGASVSETNGNVDYFVFKDMPAGTLKSQLQNLSLAVTDSTLTEIAPSFAFGTFERGTTDIAWSSPITQTFTVSGRAPLYYTTDSIERSSNDAGFDGMFSIDPLNLVPEADQDPQILQLGDQQFIQLTVGLPDNFTVIRESGKTNWVEGATVGGVATYTIAGVTLTEFYAGSVADLVLKPVDDYYTDPAGVTVVATVTSYLTDPNIDGLDPIGTPPTATLKVQPEIAAGSVDSSVAQISLAENQDDGVDNWVLLSDFIALDTLSALDGATTNLVLILVDGLNTSSIEIRQDSVELSPDSSAGEHTFRLPIASTDLSSIEIQSLPYVAGTFTGEFYLETSVPGWPTVVSDSTVITGEITPTASGINQEVTVATGHQGTEDATFALSDLIMSDATLLDTDGSETLVYQITLPTTVYLQITSDVNGSSVTRMLGGRLTGDARLFEINASEVADYQVLPKASFAGTNLDFSVTPIGVESDGSESLGTTQNGTFDILGVSEAPLVATPTTLSGLLTDTNSSISVPIVVSRQDPDETLSVTLDVTSNGNPVTDVTLTINGTAYTPDTGGLVTVATADIPFLSTMTLSSSSDYRGAESLQIAVNASSQDGTATPASASVRTIDVSIYQPVVAPTVTAVSSAIGGEKVLDLTLDVSAAPTGIDQTDVTLLVTGVPSTTYFLDATDAPVGASLGGGVWLFNGSDVFDSGPSSSLQIIQTEGAAFDLSVKAILTDAVGGTSATSPASVATVDPVDPVVAVFNATYPTVVADDVSFDFNTHSVLGDETALSWMVGDVSGGLPSGTAFFVQGDTVAGYSDLFPSLDALIDTVDVDDDGVITLTEMASKSVTLWFDSDISGILGEVDAGELFSIDALLSDFTVTSGQTAVTSDYSTSQSILSADESITLIDQMSFDYSTTEGVSGSGAVFGTAIPFETNFVSQLDLADKPQAVVSVPETVNEDRLIPVSIDFTAMDLSSNPSATVVNLVKVFGVPEAAMLNGAVYVEGATAAESYWIAQVVEGQNDFTLKFSESHVTGSFALEVEPLVSVSDVSTMLFETVLGPTTSSSFAIIPQAEADLTIFRTDDTAIEMSEGGLLTLSELAVSVMSPDDQETLFIQFEVTNALTGESIDTSSIFVLNGQPYKGYLEANGQLWIPASGLDAGLQVQLPEFFSDSFDITMTPVSRHGDDIAVGTNSLTVPVTVNPSANGVDSVSLTLSSSPDAVETNFTEGESIWLTPEATLIDPNESLIYQITVGGAGVDLALIESLNGRTATATDLANNIKIFEFDAEDVLGPMELVADSHFDGQLEIQVGAASIDPVSGNQSVYQNATIESITLLPNPGNLATTVEFDVPDDLVDTVNHIRFSGSEEAIAGVESFNGVVTGTLSADGQSILFAPGGAGGNTVGINPLMKESLTVDLLDSTDSVISTESIRPDANSFNVSFRQNGIRVEELSVVEGQPLNFEVRLQGYDADESFSLTSSSGQFTVTPTLTGFTVSLAAAPKPSVLSVIDDLRLTISENGQSQSITLPSLPVSITPIANGVKDVSVAVYADEAGTSTDFIEGQSLWITPSATLVDASETLIYQIKVGGSGLTVLDEETNEVVPDLSHVKTLGGSTSTTFSGDNKVFEVKASELDGPLELVLDPLFDDTLDIQVGAKSIDPVSGDETAFTDPSLAASVVSMVGVPGVPSSVEYLQLVDGDWTSVNALSLTEGETNQTFKIRVTTEDLDETVGITIPTAMQSWLTIDTTSSTASEIALVISEVPKPTELGQIENLTLTVTESGLNREFTLPSFLVSITPIANGVENLSVGLFADQALTDTEIRELGEIWVQPLGNTVDPNDSIHFTRIGLGGTADALAAITTLGGVSPSEVVKADGQSFKVFDISDLEGPFKLEIDSTYDGPFSTAVEAFSLDEGNLQNPSASQQSSIGTAVILPTATDPENVKLGQLNYDNVLIDGISGIFGLAVDFIVRVTPQDSDESFELSLPNNVTLISGPTIQSSGDVDFNVRLEPEFFGLLEDAPEIFQIEGIEVISREGTDISTYSVPTQDIAVNVNQAAAPVFSDLLTNPIRIEMPGNPDDLVAEAILNLEQFVVANKNDADFENDTTHYELSLASNTYLEKFGEGRDISLRYDADDFTRHGIEVDWDEEGKKYRFEGLRSVVTSPVVLSITTSLLADQAFAQAIFGDLRWTAVNTEPTTGLSKSTDIGLLLSKEVTGDVIVVDGEAVQVFFAHTFQNDVVEYRITQIGDQNISEGTMDAEQLGQLSDASLATVEATLTDAELGSITKKITSDVFVLPNKNQLGLSIADASDSLSNAVESYFESGYWGALGQATETVDSNQFTFIDPDFGIEVLGVDYEIGVSTLSDRSDGKLFAEDGNILNRVHGTKFNDFLVARAPDVGANEGSVLFGAQGENTLLGNIGDDVLVSAGGHDILTGNAGADVFQIVTDTKNAETSVSNLENALDRLLGLDVDSETHAFKHQEYESVDQASGQSTKLVDALRDIHSDLGVSDSSVDLRAVVTDFTRGFNDGESDRLVMAGVHGSDAADPNISAHHLTWGDNDYIYVVAQSIADPTAQGSVDAFVSALLIPEFSPVDIALTDLESAGIYAV